MKILVKLSSCLKLLTCYGSGVVLALTVFLGGKDLLFGCFGSAGLSIVFISLIIKNTSFSKFYRIYVVSVVISYSSVLSVFLG